MAHRLSPAEDYETEDEPRSSLTLDDLIPGALYRVINRDSCRYELDEIVRYDGLALVWGRFSPTQLDADEEPFDQVLDPWQIVPFNSPMEVTS